MTFLLGTMNLVFTVGYSAMPIMLVASCYESIATVCRRFVARGFVLWPCAFGVQLHWRSWLRISTDPKTPKP